MRFIATDQGGKQGQDSGKRIVLTTVGSLGDLHPYLAIGLGLKARGHEAIIATSACYRSKVEALGLGFRAIRPESDFVTDAVAMRRIMDIRWGTIRVLRELILPTVRESYEDTFAASEGADLLVSHALTFTTRLVSEKTGIPWASTMVTPLGFSSVYDPPALPIIPDLSLRLRFLGPSFWRPLRWSLKRATRVWASPLDRLRAEIGLPPSQDNPLVDGHSPAMVLALFSKVLAAKQQDWPPQTIVTGFPFYDRDGESGIPSTLARFLKEGPLPLVFTLSVSAGMVAGEFYEQSIAAAKSLGQRAVLVVGRNQTTRLDPLPEGMLSVDYAPFSELFPSAAVVIHAGGIGTTGLAMQSGRPMLVVPFAHDQPDNAARAARIGIARTLSRHRYTEARVKAELRELLENPGYAKRSREVGEQIQREQGVKECCDALETLL